MIPLVYLILVELKNNASYAGILDVGTTMIYAHVLNKGVPGVRTLCYSGVRRRDDVDCSPMEVNKR